MFPNNNIGNGKYFVTGGRKFRIVFRRSLKLDTQFLIEKLYILMWTIAFKLLY